MFKTLTAARSCDSNLIQTLRLPAFSHIKLVEGDTKEDSGTVDLQTPVLGILFFNAKDLTFPLNELEPRLLAACKVCTSLCKQMTLSCAPASAIFGSYHAAASARQLVPETANVGSQHAPQRLRVFKLTVAGVQGVVSASCD